MHDILIYSVMFVAMHWDFLFFYFFEVLQLSQYHYWDLLRSNINTYAARISIPDKLEENSPHMLVKCTLWDSNPSPPLEAGADAA